jgi:hypothetical protein
MGNWYRCKCFVSDFAAWAVSEMEWEDLPPELVAMAKYLAEPAAPSASKTTRHKLDRRENILDPVIKKARATAIDPDHYQSVWAELVELAGSESKPNPLVGYVEGEGIKYQDPAGVKFLTIKNLRERMKRKLDKARPKAR